MAHGRVDQGLTETPSHAGFIERFALPTRLIHWALAIPFLLLLLTGLTNYAPSLKATQVADVRIFAWLHVVIGFSMLGIVAWILLTQLPRRSVRSDVRELSKVSVDDYLWAQHQVLRAAGEDSIAPLVGKFNAGQKLNSLISALVTAGLLFTGVILGINYTTKEVFSVHFVEEVFPWHTRLALLIIPVVLGHLYLALIHPSTRESLRGMTLGRVRREWAHRHHPAWADAVDDPTSPTH